MNVFLLQKGGVAVDELFVAWTKWCSGEGRSYPGTKATFGRDLRAAFPEIKKRRRNIDGNRPYYYEGLVLKYIPDPTANTYRLIPNPLMEGGEWVDSVNPGFGPCKVRAITAKNSHWS